MIPDVLIPVQRYVTVLLLFVAAFMWLLLRKNRGEDGLDALRINRAYTVMVLVILPFIVGNFTFFSEDIARVGNSFLLALIFLIMFIVLFKFNKKNSAERIKDLKDLMKGAQKHPIKYEFARKIVLPELKKLKEEEEKFAKTKTKFISEKQKEMDALNSKEKNLEVKLKRVEELSEFIKNNQKKTEEKADSVNVELGKINNAKKDLEKRKLAITKHEDYLNAKINEVKLRKKELESLTGLQKLDIAKKTKLILEEVRENAIKEIEDRERKLDISKTELGALKRDVTRREKNFNPRIKLMEKREKEVEARFSKLRIKESEINESLDNLSILKKQFSKDERALKKRQDEFKNHSSEVVMKEKKAEHVKESYLKSKSELNTRESELNTFEAKLARRKRDLDALERRIARKNKEVSILEVRLNKQLEETTKKEKDDGFGDIISEDVYSSKKDVGRKNGNK